MVRSISALNLFNTKNVQGLYASNLKENTPVQVAKVEGPRAQALNMNDMAAAIQKTQNNEDNNALNFKEVLDLFKSGKFDPRKMGEIVIKSGNDVYRIYVGKDDRYGDKDLIIFENKKLEAGSGKISGRGMKIIFTFEDYDKMVEATRKQQPAA